MVGVKNADKTFGKIPEFICDNVTESVFSKKHSGVG